MPPDQVSGYTETDSRSSDLYGIDPIPVEAVEQSSDHHVAIDDDGRVWIPLTSSAGKTRYLEADSLVTIEDDGGAGDWTAYAEDCNTRLSLPTWEGVKDRHDDLLTMEPDAYGWNFTSTPVDPERFKIDNDG